jgi:proteasome accessory factor C
MPVTSATERLRRLLALVPWVAAHPDGVPVDEVCARFDLTRARLLDDLDTVMMVGVHPFTPDTLIDVWVADDRVTIRYADSFTRPLRLTPGEAVALVAAARALLATPGSEHDGPLARALDKLIGVLGADAPSAVDIQLGHAAPEVFDALGIARRDRDQVDIDYYRPDQDERQVRRIEPAQLWSAEGRWYVSGWCHQASAVRTFRVDRIASVEATGVPFEHEADDAPTAVEFGDELPQVVLDVARNAVWNFEEVPVLERIDGNGGAVRLRVAVASERWLARTLVQLGPDVTVVSTDPLLDVGRLVADEAATLLGRYR